MSEHTKEPWRTAIEKSGSGDFQTRVEDSNGNLICDLWDNGNNHADSARIAACVNACSDVPNDILDKIANKQMSGSEFFELGKVTAQRDELLEALKGYLANDGSDKTFDVIELNKYMKMAKAAIAKCESKL